LLLFLAGLKDHAMSDTPSVIHITEEGPREGFQFEKSAIPTARKIRFIDALSRTGIDEINIVSFVNPKLVPGMADAEQVVQGIAMQPGIRYTGLWLNRRGFERALASGRLSLEGNITLCGSDAFLARNQNRSAAEQVAEQHIMLELYKEHGVHVSSGFIMAAFGCNFSGDVPVQRVVRLVGEILAIGTKHGVTVDFVMLADTMGWATPQSIKRVVGAVREAYPQLAIGLHLHDTRGMGIANAFSGLEMGVAQFDASTGGLGGCPFAGHSGAAGNLCTEDLVFMCNEMGIETGIDLEALIECARLAENVVGHWLPGSVMHGGSLERLRRKLRG
jgi:hydroxymethylglutaryl-CoA lyase